jgi:hypothetical protein
MSTWGQTGSILGGIAGMAMGNPGLGMTIGGLIGAQFDAPVPNDQEGPRLNDLTLTGVSYGESIPKTYGSYRASGNIIWSNGISELRHENEEEVGKGSQDYDVIYYTYSVDMAVALCEGPIERIRKVWADGVKIYDFDLGGPTVEFLSTEEASGQMEFYYGTSTQEPNWLLQSYEADTPAYRNVVYIVFNKFQLEKFGNRVPNITAEVVTSVSDNTNLNVLYAGARPKHSSGDTAYGHDQPMYRGPYGTFRSFEIPQSNDGVYRFEYPNVGGIRVADKNFVGDSSSYNFVGPHRYHMCADSPEAGFLRRYSGATLGQRSVMYYPNWDNSDNIVFQCNSTNWASPPDYSVGVPPDYSMYHNGELFCVWYENDFYDSDYRFAMINVTDLLNKDTYYIDKAPEPDICYPNEKKDYTISCSYDVWVEQRDPYNPDHLLLDIGYLIDDNNYDFATPMTAISDNYIYVYRYKSTGTPVHEYRVYDRHTGNHVTNWSFSGSVTSGLERTYAYAIADHDIILAHSIASNKWHFYRITNGIKKYLGGTHVYASPTSFPAPKTSDYIVYEYEGIGGLYANYPYAYIYGRRGTSSATGYSHAAAIVHLENYDNDKLTLAEIVYDLLIESELEDYEIDVTDGESTLVTGFSRTKQMSARAAINSLQSIYLFDLLEDDFQIILKMRGSESIHTITEDDIIEDDISIKRKLDTELPYKITNQYKNYSRDFLEAAQSTQIIDSNSKNIVTNELPIVLTDDEAKQLTEKLMYNQWSNKITVTLKTKYHSNIKIGRIITLDYKDVTYNCRIIKLTLVGKHELDCDLVVEDGSAYISDAIAEDTSQGFLEYEGDLTTGTALYLFNAPTLNNAVIDKDILYYAAGGYGESWNGCEVYKSSDEGQTYNSVGVILNPIPFGVTKSTLASGPTTVYDLTNSVTLELSCYGELESKTWEELLQGRNYIKVGQEILQFKDVVDNNDGTLVISNLLRGRRGTEWAVSSHSTGEGWVFLNETELQVTPSTYNVNAQYKAISFGKLVEDDYKTISTDRTNLKPFSPSMVGLESSDFDDTITWLRRDRYIRGYMQALPMSEQTEEYTVTVQYKNQSSVLATFTSTVPEIEVLESDKSGNGIILGTDLLYKIYQNSYVYGLGEVSSIIKEYSNSYYNYIFNNASSYWSFNETSGSYAYDVLGGYNIYLTSGHTKGLTGSLPNTSSTSMRFTNKTNTVFRKCTTMTLMFSFSPTNTDTTAQLVLNGHDGQVWRQWYVARTNSTTVRFGSDGTVAEGISTNISATADWVTVTVTHDGTNQRIYIDGQFRKTNDYPLRAVGEYRLQIAGVDYYDDNVRIDEMIYFHNKVLTDQEIADLYQLSQEVDY